MFLFNLLNECTSSVEQKMRNWAECTFAFNENGQVIFSSNPIHSIE